MSKTLDQERVLDTRKRQRFTLPIPEPEQLDPPAPQAPHAAEPAPPLRVRDGGREVMPSDAGNNQAERGAATPTPATVQAAPAHRRTVLRITLFVLLLELAAIAAFRPPLFVPDPVLVRAHLDALPDRLAHVTAELSAWLHRPADPTPQIPSAPPLRGRDGGREAMPSEAGNHQAERGTAPTKKRPEGPLHSASATPVPRALATNALAPRSTALDDARKVLRLMETALQDAAHAVVTAQAGTEE